MRHTDDMKSAAVAARSNAEWQQFRALFPALSRSAYLNTAFFGPVSTEAALAARSYYEDAEQYGDRGDHWKAQAEACRAGVARLLGAAAAEIGFVHNASMAMSCAALIFEGTGSVLTAVNEHPAVVTPWLARRYRVHTAQPDESGRFTPQCYERALQPDTRVIAISHARYNDGQVNDIEALGALARERGLHLVVDASQSMGVLPVQVGTGVDALCFGSFKWLNAGDGCGALYVRDGVLARYGLPIAGNRSRRVMGLHEIAALDPLLEARAFELGSANLPNILALNAAQALIDRIGIDAIAARAEYLSRRLREGLLSRGFRIAGSPTYSPIVSFQVKDAEAAVAQLRERGVVTSPRDGRVRAAVSWYNNEEDIDTCLEALAAVARS